MPGAFIIFYGTYFAVNAEVEFFVAGSNCHLGVGLRIITCAWLEHNVSVVFEATN